MALLGKLKLAAAAILMAAVPAGAQLFVNAPDFRAGPSDGSEPGIGLPIPGATPAEYRAHLLWNLRSGLNVAALQCQFSPQLRVVDNYNGILAHHSAELAAAYTVLGDYFRRTHGAKEAQRLFDDYSTKTYNGFSTLYAQLGFCQTAGSIGRDVLARPKGEMNQVARLRMREFRNSLVPFYDRLTLAGRLDLAPLVLPPLDERCYDKKNRLRKRCGGLA